MTEFNNEPSAVDRREEVVVTQEPGFEHSEHVVRDVAAERRLALYQVSRIIWLVASVLEILLAIRFVLKLIAANPNSGFAAFIYGITALFMAPFAGLTASPSANGMVLEVPTLIAMVIYALFFWIVVRLIWLIFDQPSSRVVATTTHEQPPGVPPTRTTHSTTRVSTTDTERPVHVNH